MFENATHIQNPVFTEIKEQNPHSKYSAVLKFQLSSAEVELCFLENPNPAVEKRILEILMDSYRERVNF